jgi:hypothetical protein
MRYYSTLRHRLPVLLLWLLAVPSCGKPVGSNPTDGEGRAAQKPVQEPSAATKPIGDAPQTRPGAALEARLEKLIAEDLPPRQGIFKDENGAIVRLDLSRLKISDALIAEVSGLTQLKELDLFLTTPRTLDLRPLARLPHLTNLNLMDHRMTPTYLSWLEPTSPLKQLNVGGAKGVSKNVPYFAKVRSLRILGLDATDVTDADLKMIAQLPELKWLHLNGTAVTDTGIAQLSGVRSLRRLDLLGAAVTDEMAQRLRTGNPELSVQSFYRPPGDAE